MRKGGGVKKTKSLLFRIGLSKNMSDPKILEIQVFERIVRK